MDFSLTDLFVEMLVAGVLFVLALSPLLIWLLPSSWHSHGLLPGSDRWNHPLYWVVLFVALSYPVGIAGNRLAQNLYTCTGIDPLPRVNGVEMAVRDQSEQGRDYVERHKTYLKVTRAASCASVLFILTMTLYNAFGPRDIRKPYSLRHFVAVLAFGLPCLIAFRVESVHYWKQLVVYNQRLEKPGSVSAKDEPCCFSWGLWWPSKPDVNADLEVTRF
jgi:hypothetical protein